MTIAKQSIDEIHSRADIVAEIGARLDLKKTGSNYVGLCPFHTEKSPSFNVSPTKQFFHCFGCGKSGDVIAFLMEHDGMQFHEAVQDLGERLGIKVEQDQCQSQQDLQAAQVQRKAAQSLEDVCEHAARFYQDELLRTPAAQAYANKRGLSDEVMVTYGIGYASNPPSRTALSSAFPHYGAPELIQAGLVGEHHDNFGRSERYDRFRNRLIFPIRNVRGRCIGFGGRVLGDEKPKYLNSPETPIFIKHKVLYGLHEARAHITTEKLAFVTEGYMDVVSMAQYGVGNTVATLGTAFSEDHLRLLLRFTDRVCFVFDGDAPGKKAAAKALRVTLPLMEPRHSFAFLTLPDEQDPDDFLRTHGKERFLQMAKAAPMLSQYLIATLLEQFGADGKLTSAEAKTQFSVAARDLCSQIVSTNPMKELLIQEIDTAIGRVPRASAADRLRSYHGATDNSGAPEAGHYPASPGQLRKTWLPREEWLKTQKTAGTLRPLIRHFGGFGSTDYGYAPAMVAPTLDTKTLWQRLVNAVVVAPHEAALVASALLAMLDAESSEETPLMLILKECTRMPFNPERHAPDVLQAAIDLLRNAPKLLIKQRTNEVSQELRRLHAQGEMSEGEFVTQMLRLSA